MKRTYEREVQSVENSIVGHPVHEKKYVGIFEYILAFILIVSLDVF